MHAVLVKEEPWAAKPQNCTGLNIIGSKHQVKENRG